MSIQKIEASGLEVRAGKQQIIRQCDICIERGEIVLLSGANGSGKTTLLNSIAGYLKPSAGILRYSGTATDLEYSFDSGKKFLSRSLRGFNPTSLARLGVIKSWQGVRLFPHHTVVENLLLTSPEDPGTQFWNSLFSALRGNPDENSRVAQAKSLLDTHGLGGMGSRYGNQLSFGEGKRVALLRACQHEPGFVFLDEPLSGLDSSGVCSIVEMIAELNKTLGISFVIAEHHSNLCHLEPLGSRRLILSDGNLEAEPPEFMRSGDAALSEALSGFSKSVSALNAGARVTTFSKTGATQQDELLAVENLVVKRGGRRILACRDTNGVSFSVRRGEISLLEAPNGWGKSSLLDAIMGKADRMRGKIVLCGKNLEGPTLLRSRAGAKYLTSINDDFPSLTVTESLRLSGAGTVELGVASLGGRTISTLSGGERQRVRLAGVLGAIDAQVLLLDEPFVGMDREATASALQFLVELSRSVAILIAEPSAQKWS